MPPVGEFLSLPKRFHGPWIQRSGMDAGVRKSVKQAAQQVQVPLFVLPLGYTGYFARSTVHLT